MAAPNPDGVICVDTSDEEVADPIAAVLSPEEAENQPLIVKLWFAGVPLILLQLIHVLLPALEVMRHI